MAIKSNISLLELVGQSYSYISSSSLTQIEVTQKAYSIISVKCRHFRRNNFFLLIVRVFISFTKQFFIFHSNRVVKCEKQILLSMGFEPTTSCIRGKHLTARPRVFHISLY